MKQNTMKETARRIFSLFICIAALAGVYAFANHAPSQQTGMQQVYDPVKWSFTVQDLGQDEFELVAKANIEEGWHVYALHASNDPSAMGPVSTTLAVDKTKFIELIGGPTEGKFITHFDINFDMDLNYFEGSAVYRQRFKAVGVEPFNLTGSLEFMTCNEERCLPPDIKKFSVKVIPQKALEQ